MCYDKPMKNKYSPYWLNFIYYFNVKRDFFECHEHGEYLWLNSGRPDCLKGLIQVAISFYHLGRGNGEGAQIMRYRGVEYIRPYSPVWEGLDVKQLITDTEAFYAHVDVKGRFTEEEISTKAPQLFFADPELKQMVGTWIPFPLPKDETWDDESPF